MRKFAQPTAIRLLPDIFRTVRPSPAQPQAVLQAPGEFDEYRGPVFSCSVISTTNAIPCHMLQLLCEGIAGVPESSDNQMVFLRSVSVCHTSHDLLRSPSARLCVRGRLRVHRDAPGDMRPDCVRSSRSTGLSAAGAEDFAGANAVISRCSSPSSTEPAALPPSVSIFSGFSPNTSVTRSTAGRSS